MLTFTFFSITIPLMAPSTYHFPSPIHCLHKPTAVCVLWDLSIHSSLPADWPTGMLCTLISITNIEVETKWQSLCRLLFLIHFLNRNCCNLIKIWLNFIPEIPVNNMLSLVPIKAWQWTADKPLPVQCGGLVYWCIDASLDLELKTLATGIETGNVVNQIDKGYK